MIFLFHVVEWLIGTCVAAGTIVCLWLLYAHRSMERKREEARNTTPSAGEVWLMDGKPLYIKATAKHGLLLVVEIEGEIHSWWEVWGDWQMRLRARIVLRTGQTVQAPGG